MNSNQSAYRNIVLISQVSICVMVPLFLCIALGVWLDNKFGTWFTLPLLFLGMAAGVRNAYVMISQLVKTEEAKRKKALEEEIQRKVDEANAAKKDSEASKS